MYNNINLIMPQMKDVFYFNSEPKSFEDIFFDSHAHIQYDLSITTEDVIKNAKSAKLNKIVCVGTDAKTSLKALNLSENYQDFVYATAGLHPYESDKNFQEILEIFNTNKNLVAVGETGLDFYNCKIEKAIQIESLKKHASLAARLNLPIILHLRPFDECFDPIIEILEQEKVKKAIFHCFSGNFEQAKIIWTKGYKTSFACNVTYKKNSELLEIFKACPLKNLLIETDTPYLSPQKLRGSENQPANIKYLKSIYYGETS